MLPLIFADQRGGVHKLNKEKIVSEKLLEGKFLASTSNMAFYVADVAMGYKHLLEIKWVYRDMKKVFEIRLVYHRLDNNGIP